jgi:hypothetical protein
MQIKYYNDPDIDNVLLMLFNILDKKKQSQVLLVIHHILRNNWSPIPPNAKPLGGNEDEMNEIRIKFWENLYRINYFIDREQDYMVILNWYNKPDGRSWSNNYNKAKKRKLDKMIEAKIEEAFKLKENYFLNIWNYELYN